MQLFKKKRESEGERSQKYMALVDLILKRSALGLEGDLDIQLPGDEGQKAGLSSMLVYRQEQKDLTFDGKIKDINPSRFADFFSEEPLISQQNFLLNGNLKLALNSQMKLQNASLVLNIPEGEINIPEEFENPILIKDVNFDFSIHREDQKMSLNKFEANIMDIPIEAKAEGTFKKGHIHFPITVNIPEVQFENIATLLPQSMDETSASDWVKNKLKDGYAKNLILTKDIGITRDLETKERSLAVTNVRAEFDFEGLTVLYSDTLMPVKEAKGSGVYEDDSLKITGESARVGDIVGSDISMTMTDISVEGGGFATIKLKGKGPLKTALNYITAEPIELTEEEIGIDAKKAEGNISYDLDLRFPTLKDLPKEEVTVIIDGVLTDVKLPNIVQDLQLENGPYDLNFAKGKVTLKGKGTLSGRPLDLNYQQYLDPKGQPFDTKVDASIIADKGLRDSFGIDLDEYISGNVPIDIVYTSKGNDSAVIDVKGKATPTTIHIEPFAYKKEPGVDGDFSLKVLLKDDVVQEIDNFDLKTAGLSFDGARILFRKKKNNEVEISRGSIKQAKLGRTSAKVDFEFTPDNVLKVVSSGPVVDLNPFLNKDKKSLKNQQWNKPQDQGGQAMKISFKADKVYTVEDEFLKKAQFYLETDKDTDITRLEIDSGVGEKGVFYVRFKPEGSNGNRTFRMESTDAGATLKTFDLYKDMRGGKIIIYGRPQAGDKKGNLYGTARVENFTVVNAPALARLLGALSLNGAQDALRTKGVSFSKLESEFEWRFRNDGNLLIVKKGRTSGSSLGLTFEGVTDMGEETIDISGTVIPLSGVNKAISDIPLIGNILTGGSAGGLFAATYTMSGPSREPKVVINPLSVLTPGIFRKILFEGGYESKLPENKPANKNIPKAEKKGVNE